MRWNGMTVTGAIAFAAGWVVIIFFSGRDTELGLQVFNLHQAFIGALLILSGMGLVVVGQAVELLKEVANVAVSLNSANARPAPKSLSDMLGGSKRGADPDWLDR